MNYARIQYKIDRGLGIAAKHLGQPYQLYRLTSGSNGNFPAGWTRIIPSPLPIGWLPTETGQTGAVIQMYKTEISEAKIEWSFKGSSVKFYQMFGPAQSLLLGDVLLQVDPTYDVGLSYGPGATILPGTDFIQALGFAWHMPVNIPVGAWINRTVTIWRPALIPEEFSDTSLYWNETHDNDTPLILANGQFSFTNGNASVVPMGLSASERSERGQLFSPDPPGMTVPVRFYGYLPPLPGYKPREGDAIITDDDERYVVIHPYRQEAGVVGTNLVLHRTIAAP